MFPPSVICCSDTRPLLRATNTSVGHHPLAGTRGIFTSDANDGRGRDNNEHGDHHQKAGIDLPQGPLPSHGTSHEGFEDPWLAVTSLELSSQGTLFHQWCDQEAKLDTHPGLHLSRRNRAGR